MVPSRPADDQGSWSDLVAGIITDATQLFRKEVDLAKIEIRNDLRNLKALLTGIAIGAILVVLGIRYSLRCARIGTICLYNIAAMGMLWRGRRRVAGGRRLLHCRGQPQK